MRYDPSGGSDFKKGLAQVKVKNGQAAILFRDETDPIHFGIEGTPEHLKNGRYYMKVRGNQEIVFYGPILGTHKAKVKRFAENKEGIPTPVWKDGTWGPYQIFFVVLEILDFIPGAEVHTAFFYKFVEDNKAKGKTIVAGKGDSVKRLLDFLEATGAMEEDIPYSDNILPALQKIILKKDREFVVMIKDGLLESVAEDPNAAWSNEVPDVEEVEDAVDDFGDSEESWTPEFDD